MVVVELAQSMSKTSQCELPFVKEGIKKSLLQNERFLSWKQFWEMGDGKSVINYDAECPVVIVYTGGTTGGSKGVLLSNQSILAVACQYVIAEKNLYKSSKWMQIIPLFVGYGITCSLMIPLVAGMTLILCIPMTETIASMCKKFRPNHIMYGPAFWERFADENKNLDLSKLITPVTGGDTLHEQA